MVVDLGIGSPSPITFLVDFDKGKLNRILKRFRREATIIIGREIKKIMMEEKRNTQSYLKRRGKVRGDAPHKIAESLGVTDPIHFGDTVELLFGSFDSSGIPDGVEGSRSTDGKGNLAELYEEGRPSFVYRFRGGGKGTAHQEGRPIVPSKIMGFGGTMANYLPPGIQKHPGYPTLKWRERTQKRAADKLLSDRIPRKLAEAFGANYYDKRFR